MTGFALGNTLVVTVSVKDGSSAAGMRFRYKLRGSATETEVAMAVDDDTAIATFVPSAAGWWDYKVWRTSGVAVAEEGSFWVTHSTFGADPA